jgi:tRNA threonylcarbamoyladenosine biosynthesis protein TsaE
LTADDHDPAIVGTPSPTPPPARPAVPPEPLALRWPDEGATAAFAARLAAQPALRDAFVTLDGPLGAGKTTLVRHLLRALGVRGRIKSPTYAVVEPHESADAPGGPLAIWHFDFYRFDDPREWEDAGFRDLFAAPGLKIAEWPDKAAAVLPPADLAIRIAPDAADSAPAGPGRGHGSGAGDGGGGLCATDASSAEEDGDAGPAPARLVRLTAGTARGRALAAALRDLADAPPAGPAPAPENAPPGSAA